MVSERTGPRSADRRQVCVRLFDAIHRAVAKEAPDLDSMLMTRACVAFAYAENDGVDLDVTSFAVSVGVSRSRASRFLRDWERNGYCRLRRTGSRTLVLPTQKFEAASARIYGTVADVIAGAA